MTFTIPIWIFAIVGGIAAVFVVFLACVGAFCLYGFRNFRIL